MKRFILPIVAATALLTPSLAGAAEAIYGVWVREGHPEDKLEFFDCSGKLCAKGILPMPDGSPPPLVLRNAAKAGPNKWKGDLFNPEDGKTYKGEITLETQEQLSLAGCLVAFLCQSETWTKVSGPTQKPKPTEPKPSDAKSGDAKSSDAKSSDPKSSDAKSSDSKPLDAKSGAAKPAKGAGHEPAKPAVQDPAKPADKSAAKPKPTPTKPKAAPAE